MLKRPVWIPLLRDCRTLGVAVATLLLHAATKFLCAVGATGPLTMSEPYSPGKRELQTQSRTLLDGLEIGKKIERVEGAEKIGSV